MPVYKLCDKLFGFFLLIVSYVSHLSSNSSICFLSGLIYQNTADIPTVNKKISVSLQFTAKPEAICGLGFCLIRSESAGTSPDSLDPAVLI